MPHYDYQCETCGHVFEIFQSMTADKLTDCPQDNCAGNVKRLLGTGAGIVFKGTGFYETDFKDKKGTPPQSPSSSSKKSPPAKSEAKPTSKKES